MTDEKYPLIETDVSEESMFFSTDFRDQACIGHLRGDFGSGTEFWTTWWDHHDELKDQGFKDKLDDIVNTLRKSGPLQDLRAMEQFCRKHEQARLSSASGRESFGLRVDTAQHRYYLRMFPLRGNYNFYIYCYKAALLEKTIKVLVVEPMKPCRVQEISDTLETMQAIVGGYIEEVTPFSEPVAIVLNEQGKMRGLPLNRPLTDRHGIPYDFLCGTFFIAGVEGEHFVSLTDHQIRTYKELYDNMVVLTAEKDGPQSPKQSKGGKNHER